MGPIVVVAALAFGLALGVLVTAIIIRASVSLYNKMAGGPGSPTSVPEPAFGRALGVAVVAIVIDAVLGFMAGLAGASLGLQARLWTLGFGWIADNINILANILSIPVSLISLAGVFAFMLPTSFGRGILVMLCYVLVCIFVVVVFGLIFGLIFFMLWR